MKKSELSENIRKRLERLSTSVEWQLDEVIAELQDLKAQLYGGYSASFGSEITEAGSVLGNPDVQVMGTHKDFTKVARKLGGIAFTLHHYDTIMDVAVAIDMNRKEDNA
jgi:hypothetical protein